jgi:hypothetical protein
MTAVTVVTNRSGYILKMRTLRRKLEQIGNDVQVKELIQAIDRRLARIRAEKAGAFRYTVVFEKPPDDLCWQARILELPDSVQVIGNTLEEAAVRIARRISKTGRKD